MSNSTKVVTGTVRLSYLNVFSPRSSEDGAPPKYSVSLIIPKSDKMTLQKINQAIEAAKEAGKAKWGGKAPANLKTPLHDGDAEKPDDKAYENAYYMNASSRTKPGVVDRNLNSILDSTELYSGCYGRAEINFYAFNTNGNRGIAVGLNNLQKIKDGESLSGRSRAEDVFGVFEDDDDFLN